MADETREQYIQRALGTIERHFGESRPTEYYQSQLNLLGRTGYMDLYPSWFEPAPFIPLTARKGWKEEQKIRDYQGLLAQFTGPESAFIRWLINNKIRDLQYEVARVRGVTEARPPTYTPPPVPNWMQKYIVPAGEVTEWKSPGTKRRGFPTPKKAVYQLTPLSAQEELTSTQQAQLAGYMAWQKAGAPTAFSESAVRRMAEWPRWWEEYTRLSESLFPKQAQRTTRWRTAEQK